MPTSNPSQSPVVRFGMGLAAGLFILSGPVSGYFLTKILLQSRASASWPSTEGVIAKAQVSDLGMRRYAADVSYTYTVEGHALSGSRIRVSDGESESRDAIAQELKGLTVGQAVPVYYDPANPHDSVLRPGARFQEYAILVVPLGLLAIGVGAISLLRRTRSSGVVPPLDSTAAPRQNTPLNKT